LTYFNIKILLASIIVVSAEPHVSEKYAIVEDFLDELGLTEAQIKALSEQRRNRYQTWVLQGQNNVEAAIAKINPDITIADNTPQYTFARNAVLAWALYKKRQKDGSPSKDDAKADYDLEIEYLTNVLQSDRGSRVKAVAILGKSQRNSNILLPSQLDTEFYGKAREPGQ
jgi:hypothetical protein